MGCLGVGYPIGGMRMTELKPCPFCGNTEVRGTYLHVDDRCNPYGYAIFCDACDCILTNRWGVDKEIVRLWNRRVEE